MVANFSWETKTQVLDVLIATGVSQPLVPLWLELGKLYVYVPTHVYTLSCLSVYLSCLSSYLPTHLLSQLPIFLPTCLSYLSACLPIYQKLLSLY